MRFPFRTHRAFRRATRTIVAPHTARSSDFELAVRHAEPADRDELYAAARRAGFQHL